MATQDDIEAFLEQTEAAREAADEYLRRYEKNLPPDRYTDGTIGARKVAQGIKAYQRMVELYADACMWMLHDIQKRNADAMSPGEPEAKYSG